ncbi:hypothetical protein ANNAL29_78 [Mycobacterium phage AnnaL29]|uniref:hypothetical protein n=1 Tax=Mycobacterium phage AnnaL29 TaxID=1076630 RepID=UPI00024DEB3F|nr:hypothetical protein O153_gp29 [Mycobacterium phage AnnaL29]YP_009303533.1 hypothetical protein SEA_LOSER_80 [Mycobacterium phage Loser]AGS82759.1 hypothetical protein ANNAL29_78 [Mycobacterium phage AnnaL29]AMS00976.1 hypothetical protein SEA_LOSER_80 [Mycobacterium phage Loser]
MAQDRKITKYEVSPIDNPDGTLAGLTIQKTERITRESDNGKVLNYGTTVDVGDPLEIPVGKLSTLVGDIVNWIGWYANGDAARDALESRAG